MSPAKNAAVLPTKIMLAFCALLVGCAEYGAAPRMRAANLSGFSAEFKEGYADGCASVAAPMKRDQARFNAGGQYTRGWHDGYSICTKK